MPVIVIVIYLLHISCMMDAMLLPQIHIFEPAQCLCQNQNEAFQYTSSLLPEIHLMLAFSLTVKAIAISQMNVIFIDLNVYASQMKSAGK